MESFQLVDRDGNPAGQALRAECHGNPRLIHLVVHLHVMDSKGRLYLQKRGRVKDTNPGLWDTSVGGHVSAGEGTRAALLREAREELGIDATGALFLYSYLFESAYESEYARCFLLASDGEVHPNAEEIEEGRFFAPEEIEAIMGKGMLTPMFEHEYPMVKRRLAETRRQARGPVSSE